MADVRQADVDRPPKPSPETKALIEVAVKPVAKRILLVVALGRRRLRPLAAPVAEEVAQVAKLFTAVVATLT